MARILILEHYASLRDLYRLELEEEGHEVFAVGSERELWARINDVEPHIVVMDTLLHGEQRSTWLGAIKARFGNIPMVLLSGPPLQEKLAGEDSGIPVVLKSSNLTLLKKMIGEMLGRTAHFSAQEAAPEEHRSQRGHS